MSELQDKEKEYFNYIREHIQNVKLAYIEYGERLCNILNISRNSLYKLITIHDESKYSEEEFYPYRNYFYTCRNEEKNKKAFNKACEHHYRNNPHHPEYWNGKDMDPLYMAEMLLDWEAMSMKFNDSTIDWWNKNRNTIKLSNHDIELVDTIIKRVFG